MSGCHPLWTFWDAVLTNFSTQWATLVPVFTHSLTRPVSCIHSPVHTGLSNGHFYISESFWPLLAFLSYFHYFCLLTSIFFQPLSHESIAFTALTTAVLRVRLAFIQQMSPMWSSATLNQNTLSKTKTVIIIILLWFNSRKVPQYKTYSTKDFFSSDEYALHYLNPTGHQRIIVIMLMIGAFVGPLLPSSALSSLIDHCLWAQTFQGHGRTCCLLFA